MILLLLLFLFLLLLLLLLLEPNATASSPPLRAGTVQGARGGCWEGGGGGERWQRRA